MSDIILSIDLFVFCGAILLAAILGFLVKTGHVHKKKKRILELEGEMMRAHAEILALEKNYCDLEARLKDQTIPVIAMKHTSLEDEPKKEQMGENGGQRKSRPTRTA
jgi:hypothetical protein